jgi:predicted 3-demethylubiquinone-9 3-methyltransferase (glyoxalase superfamily)
MEPSPTRVELGGGLEAAVEFYGSVFPDAALVEAVLDDDAGPGTPRTLRRVRLVVAGVQLELIDVGSTPTDEQDTRPAVDVGSPDHRTAERFRSQLRAGGSARGDVVVDRYGVAWRFPVDDERTAAGPARA